ncbi:MAG: hypothetical protein JSR58_04905 [Verrucomicrobia bacterium]|nr:hypothetical protein [Verrucomicrobiota bacterium]
MVRTLLTALILSTSYLLQYSPATLNKICEKTLYLGSACTFKSVSFLSKLMGKITLEKECELLSNLSDSAAHHSFAQVFKVAPSSHSSWLANHNFLSEVPATKADEKQLLHFLDNRWLAKSTGFFSSVVNWVYPCFGIHLQVHPESTSHYARNPSNKLSTTYEKRVAAWKDLLPHPHHFPLLLTRPTGIHHHLPSYFAVGPEENVDKVVERLSQNKSKIIVDVTHASPKDNWRSWWETFQVDFVKACMQRSIDPKNLVFIEQMHEKEIGGIRLLPLQNTSPHKIERQHRSLLKWISTLGLSANRIELDRAPSAINTAAYHSPALPSKEDFLCFLNALPPSQDVMVSGTIKGLQGLLHKITSERLQEILSSPTRAHIVQHCFSEIKKELLHLVNNHSFLDRTRHLEEIHAHTSALLEICSPYAASDFQDIYQNALKIIPSSLQSLTSCAIHSSGMTSVAGIYKATQKMLGRAPNVLFGENTYFECIHLVEKTTHAVSTMEATEEDWNNVDLIFAQFNPALKRLHMKPTEYRVEPIAKTLHQALDDNREKPLILALDCTLDYINSPRAKALLEEFSPEIETGKLQVICYRSGIKFDLLGMDNYAGAPFYMIHSQDPHWSSFDELLSDPALQTDTLSHNWFCLAYQFMTPQLDQYRECIFSNTRALLDQIPEQLFNLDNPYRIVYVHPDADAAFVDIKVSGAFHQLRAALLVGGTLSLKSLEAGHSICYRPSLGFYHPNFTVLFCEHNTTIRLTLGVDPGQVDVFTECFKTINQLQETL